MNTLKTISDLVSIKSFDTKDNSTIIEYIIDRFKPYSKEILKIKIPNTKIYNLLIGLNTEINNTNAIILSGHIDTVVADEKSYSTNPYEATLINDNLYGLGIIDMKCFFASIIDNLDTLSKSQTPIIVAITGDEETKLNGVKLLTKTLSSRNISPIFTIIGEPTNSQICTTSKGCYEYRIEITGKSCHSSNPSNGINAAYIMARIIIFIEKLNNTYSDTTLNCGIANSGEKVNIVPSFASLNFDIRSKNKENVQKVLNDIKSVLSYLENEYSGSKITINNKLVIPPLEKVNPLITNSLIKDLNLTEGEFIGGCEAGYFSELGGEAILFGTGDISLAHKPNEYMNVQDFYRYNDTFMKIIEKINKITKQGEN